MKVLLLCIAICKNADFAVPFVLCTYFEASSPEAIYSTFLLDRLGPK